MPRQSHSQDDHHLRTQHSETPHSAFWVAIMANSLFIVVQFIYSYVANSSSLFADAFHNLGDVIGLLFAWIATGLMARRPTVKATYGWKKISILAAMGNGSLLTFTSGIVVSDAIYKLFTPLEVHAVPVMIIAGVGILINGISASLFIRRAEDLNIKAAFLHLFYDALISLGVVLSAILIYWTEWFWIDPLVGLIIAFIILKGTWSLFSESLRLIIDGVPRAISWSEVSEFLLARPGVSGVHDLHIWAMSTRENALSVHLYMPQVLMTDEERVLLVGELDLKFGIRHVTIQIEKNSGYCEEICFPPSANSQIRRG